MHELPITEEVLKVVLKHAAVNQVERVVGITLKVGELRDLIEEWMQRYFDYLSRDTIAEGAKIKFIRTPIVIRCEECGKSFNIILKEWMETKSFSCKHCGGTKTALLSGREFSIEGIEVI